MKQDAAIQPMGNGAQYQDYRAVLARRRAAGQATKWAPISIGLGEARSRAPLREGAEPR